MLVPIVKVLPPPHGQRTFILVTAGVPWINAIILLAVIVPAADTILIPYEIDHTPAGNDGVENKIVFPPPAVVTAAKFDPVLPVMNVYPSCESPVAPEPNVKGDVNVNGFAIDISVVEARSPIVNVPFVFREDDSKLLPVIEPIEVRLFTVVIPALPVLPMLILVADVVPIFIVVVVTVSKVFVFIVSDTVVIQYKCIIEVI